MSEAATGVTKQRRRRRAPRRAPATSNVVILHQRIMPRHTQLLARWLDAGRRMGLCDASTYAPDRGVPGLPRQSAPADYVLVWVRENVDPAYMIRPDGIGWMVIDAVRQQPLARTHSFASALHFIRPVLPLEVAA